MLTTHSGNADLDVLCLYKRCIFYSCTTLPMTDHDFHQLLPCRQYNDLTTICNTVPSQLNSYPVHDVTKMAAQKAVLNEYLPLIRVTSIFTTTNCFILVI